MHTPTAYKRQTTRGIDFLDNRQDLRCVLLGMLGFAARHIASETGYTEGQVNYRLGLANVKVTDYRHGRSQAAKSVQRRAEIEFGAFLAKVISNASGKRVIAKNGTLYIQ